ncbi:MAG: type IV pilus assembly protein PilM [Wenzhouxiangellaceae bacterium]|nr:type IV pilus assembly protein PilM [Wenzhouxiangellaceae bacterium]
MSLFKRSAPPTVGIDIGTSSVKLLQLAQAGSALRIEHLAVEPLPEGAFAEHNINDVEAVGAAIGNAVKRSGTRARHCAMAVSGSAVITRLIHLPADLGEDEIEGQIEIEAGQYVPYPRDEVSLDFELLGPSPRNADVNEVLLAASKTENIEARQAVAEMAGLTVRVVDVEALAIVNAFDLVRKRESIPESSVIAVLDLGDVRSSLNVMRGGRSIYYRDHPFGGRELTEESMRRYGLDVEQAQFWRRDEEPPAGFEDEVLEPFRQSVIQQIGRALQFFSSSRDYARINTLYIGGGSAQVPGLVEAVAGELGMNAMRADPLAHAEVGARVGKALLEASRPGLMTACGLALRGLEP